ncbi:MAG: glycoside hydrolase family 88 protein [Verrucomicrobiales bacterium]
MNQPGSGPVVAGVLIQGVVGNRERLLRAVALGLDAEGRARGHVPGHGEMSDAVFMHCPLLAMAYVETGEKEYLEACRNHWRFMQKMCLRKDGLYRHSPLHEAAWGRGNGFPALGVSLVLQELERREESPQALREEFRAGVRAHLRALKRHQDEEGMWHQVIDHAESYAEFSATCMIGYALYAGLNGGWLAEEEFGASAAAAWEAVKGRIRLDGEFLEGVCTGTGKQKSLQAYFERKEIHGRDERGGAMALLLATERLRWEQGRGE